MATTPAPPTPVAIGVNWYTSFDRPVLDGATYWIGRGDLGSIRGGHCLCIKPSGSMLTASDPLSWWRLYDQGSEGACVGFGLSRMMSLLNRRRYDARWLFHEARKVDEWPGEDYQGTSVRAGCDVLRSRGHARVVPGDLDPFDGDSPVSLDEGISANRWATSVDQVRAVLSSPYHDRRGGVPLLNSWGEGYPHVVYLPYETLDRLIREDGEVALVTDR